MRRLLPMFLCLGFTAAAAPDGDKPAEATKAEAAADKQPAPQVHAASVLIAGKTIPYKVTVAKIRLEQDDGKPRASIFHVSYERSDVPDAASRPVLFAFNGGPGSSAVWLHLGVLGPKRVELPGDGTQAPSPPAHVVDNPLSILDVCDLVFIDPVSTGYSRAEKDHKAEDFHGLNEDIESVGDFIRRWVTEHERWSAPKYLLGESYGGIRAAGLANHLQSRFGMSLNGVVLLSTLLDFATLQTSPGNDLGYLVCLPSFTGVAHFHHKITGDRDALLRECTDFAFGEYATALLKGNALDETSRAALAVKLARFSGIDAAIWLTHNLRLDSTCFRAELLRKEGKVIGRFDARVAWDTTDPAAQAPDCDPSYELAYGAFATAMLDYLGRDLGYKEDRPYEVLTSKVNPWRWDANNSIVNVSDRLGKAMRDNPYLRVLVMAGCTDLATPPEGVAYSLRHLLEMPPAALGNILTARFDAGHMFYLNPPDLAKARAELVKFISAGKR
ncbi:MAG: peptidase S10 [Verrucomicrobia bacterium]|nr:MAG: peptidase S10 [Verrucomicrobiota bacterium]